MKKRGYIRQLYNNSSKKKMLINKLYGVTRVYTYVYNNNNKII